MSRIGAWCAQYEGSPIQQYGIKLGRLWIQYPHFRPRNLFIGVRVEEQHWEMGKRHQEIHVYVVPTVRLLLDWTFKA